MHKNIGRNTLIAGAAEDLRNFLALKRCERAAAEAAAKAAKEVSGDEA